MVKTIFDSVSVNLINFAIDSEDLFLCNALIDQLGKHYSVLDSMDICDGVIEELSKTEYYKGLLLKITEDTSNESTTR